jgi:hypothetical protein
MNYLLTFIKKILPKEIPKPLGRWKIESCINIINGKIDLSNEDHCGPCGEYALEKKDPKQKQDIQIRENKK